jgi:hypothetical protein
MRSMRQRSAVIPPSRPPTGEALLSHRRNRSAEHSNSGSFSSSSWEITSSPPQPESESADSQSSTQLHTFHYPNGYQNHHRKHVALQNVHLFYRKPLHVSDANYRAFVGLPKTPTPNTISKQCCLNVCGVFSWIAVGFFLFVYIILRFQPLYIPHSLSHQYIQRNGKLIKVCDPSNSPLTTVALHTLWAYLFVALVCQYYANPNRWRKQRYQDIPDHLSDDPKIQQSPLLPITNNAAPIGLYQDSLWERTLEGFKKWMLVKGYGRAKRKQFATKTV